jgi:hypothetical protein
MLEFHSLLRIMEARRPLERQLRDTICDTSVEPRTRSGELLPRPHVRT